MNEEKLAKLQKDWLDINEFKARFEKKEVKEFPNTVLDSVSQPVVSVHIVTYQHVNTIRKTIDGVLMQKTSFPIEIIIGDDSSTDGTREICIEYAEKFPEKIRLFLHNRENNIKVLDKPCGIFQIAYNTFHLRGKYIATCSGDDYWTDENQLQIQADFLENRAEIMSCYSDFVHNINGVIKPADFLHRLPLCTMNKNIFRKLPAHFLEVLNEDQFFLFVLDVFGGYEFVEGLKPAVYAIHGDNLWYGKQNNNVRAQHSINTAQRIYEVFQFTDFEKTAREFLFGCMKSKSKKLDASEKQQIEDFLEKVGLSLKFKQFNFLKNIQIKMGLSKL